MRILCIFLVLASMPPVQASPGDQATPRWIGRIDVGLLAGNEGGAKGGGIEVPLNGTGAGFSDAGGLEVGLEVRLSPWVALGAGAGWYRPTLEVYRDRGHDLMVDAREATVDLRTTTLEVVVTPPRWRFELGRIAIGALLIRAATRDVPGHLGLSVDESHTGTGVDARVELFLSKNRRWGIGGALAFIDLDPRFDDRETGDDGSLQVGGLLLRLGIRRAW